MTRKLQPSEALLAVSDLSVSYSVRGSAGVRRQSFDAVAGVSFAIEAGTTLALVGESGCGKSSIARAIVGLVPASAGEIRFGCRDLSQLRRRERQKLGADIQMVFQDPYSSLHPRMSVGDAIGEAWRVHAKRAPADRPQALRTLLERVGLRWDDRLRYPHEFSGGQRQRISIARALALSPRLLVLDEPVSALDVSIQAQILLLLRELQSEHGMAYLFISHDLDVVGQISDRVATMYLGRIVETGTTQPVLREPVHPYTEALLAAAPSPEQTAPPQTRVKLAGEMPSPLDPPSGCRLRTRCWLAEPICAEQEPALLLRRDGRAVACHVRNRPPEPSALQSPVHTSQGGKSL